MDAVDEPTASDFAASAGRIRKRRFSSARIQPTRVKKVMQSDEEIGRMVASVPVAIGSAMEHFAEKLLESAAQCVQFSSARTLTPSHIRYAVLKQRHFAFLNDLTKEIPVPRLNVDSQQVFMPDLRGAQPSLSLPQYDPAAQFGDAFAETSTMRNSLPASSHFSPDLNPSLVSQQVASQFNYLLPTTSTARVQPLPPTVLAAASAGTDAAELLPVKRKRGRPRKERKDNEALEHGPVANGLGQSLAMDNDRVLMPPPSVPVSSRTRRTAAFLRAANPEEQASGSSAGPPSLAV